MADVMVQASNLSGTITAPPFKSEAIRIILLSALSGVKPRSVIRLPNEPCDDIRRAVSAADHLLGRIPMDEAIDVGGSATLLRLLIPTLLSLYGRAKFRADASLLSRSLAEYADCIGCSIQHGSDGIITVKGHILADTLYEINTSGSSQFLSGMLIAMPFVENMRVKSSDALVSYPYVELTVKLMRRFGIGVVQNEFGVFHIQQSCIGKPYAIDEKLSVEGDCSYAANFIAANRFGCSVDILGMQEGSSQADAVAAQMMEQREISIKACPDLFPILCVCAAGESAITTIHGTHRLSDKESNRVMAMQSCIRALGGEMESFDDYVVIKGTGRLHGGTVDSMGDHRIAMASAIASLLCKGEPIIIRNAHAVAKSAPQFFHDFKALGGIVHEYNR